MIEKVEQIAKRKQGRPLGSSVRQNIVEILAVHGPLYGYEIYKIYMDIFPKITLRSVYYHMKKGVAIKEFHVREISRKEGNYSWGTRTENIIYELDSAATPRGDSRVKNYTR